MRNLRLFFLLALLIAMPRAWGETSDDEARRTFEEVYDKVFGPQGSTLRYNVNIVGLYKTKGTIWMKGKKSKFSDSKVDSWSDGKMSYTVYRRKKLIVVNTNAAEKGDKYASKFKFTLDDFDYSMERTQEGIWFTLKQRHEAKGTVKHVKALVDANTLAPMQVKIKVAFFWTNITISNFKSGDINDNIFVFPRSDYGSDYRFEFDH